MLKKIITVLLFKLMLAICKIWIKLIKGHRNRSSARLGSLMGSIWGWALSFEAKCFIDEPVGLFLMCTYMKFALYALLATYATSSYR